MLSPSSRRIRTDPCAVIRKTTGRGGFERLRSCCLRLSTRDRHRVGAPSKDGQRLVAVQAELHGIRPNRLTPFHRRRLSTGLKTREVVDHRRRLRCLRRGMVVRVARLIRRMAQTPGGLQGSRRSADLARAATAPVTGRSDVAPASTGIPPRPWRWRYGARERDALVGF